MDTTTTLTVGIIWHPDDATTDEPGVALPLPVQLFRMLHSDPSMLASERCGITVTMHTAARDDDGVMPTPPTPRFEPAGQTVLVVLLGRGFLNDDAWRRWFVELRERAATRADVTLVPVALSPHAANQRLVGSLHVEPVHAAASPVERDRRVRIAVLRTLVRLLNNGAPFKIFVSHARQDGSGVARALADFLDEMKGEAWVDVEQIEAGHDFRTVLRDAVTTSSAFVAVVSDAYATREWCRWEVQIAREHQLSVVVLDMVTEGQRRCLGTLGSAPVVRYNAPWRIGTDGPVPDEALVACARVFEAILQSKLCDLSFERRMRTLTTHFHQGTPDWTYLGAPPDLLTLVTRSHELQRTVVYPDPPLPDFEIALLARAVPARLATPLSLVPTLAMADGASSSPGRRLRVAVSISDPPEAELRRRALSAEHVQALVVNMSPLLLSAGHTLAYGGDPMREFTQMLADVERTYRFARDEPDEHLVNYVAPYLHGSDAIEALRDVMRIVRVQRPTISGETDAQRIIRDLTAMRERMLAETDVRVVAGGALTPGAPRTRRGPGVLEEAYLSVRHRQPLIVVGGFGGAGRLLVDALRGALDEREVERLGAHFADGAVLAGSSSEVDFREMLAAFGPDTDLHDELSDDERGVLQESTDVDAVAAVVLTAVERISRRRP